MKTNDLITQREEKSTLSEDQRGFSSGRDLGAKTNWNVRDPGDPKIVRTGLPGRPRKSPARAKVQGPDKSGGYANTSIPPEYAAIAETSITAAIKGLNAIERRKAIKDELFSQYRKRDVIICCYHRPP